MDRERLATELVELPLYDYAFFRTDELVFSQRVREICRAECAMYGRSWACPPAVGTVEECRQRVLSYEEGLMIATAREVEDASDLSNALATRASHEAVARQVADRVRSQAGEILLLSCEACAACEKCAWPDAPCRRPERMAPCIESHGILLTELAEKHGMEFMVGNNVVMWFSLILYRNSKGSLPEGAVAAGD